MMMRKNQKSGRTTMRSRGRGKRNTCKSAVRMDKGTWISDACISFSTETPRSGRHHQDFDNYQHDLLHCRQIVQVCHTAIG